MNSILERPGARRYCTPRRDWTQSVFRRRHETGEALQSPLFTGTRRGSFKVGPADGDCDAATKDPDAVRDPVPREN